MVSAQRQFFGDVFAIGTSVEGELEVAGLADQKAVRRQDSAVGVCDGKAEFAGAILCAERGDKQEKEDGIDQGDLDQNTAQMDSPRSAGGRLRYFTATTGGGCWTGALLLSGGRGEHDRSEVRHSLRTESRPRAVQAERSSASSRAASPFRNVLIQTGRIRRVFVAVMGVTVFCEILIPIPGPVDRAITLETLSQLERLLQ